MSKLTGFSNKTQWGDWNFAVEGGAVGTIGLGVFIPGKFNIKYFEYTVITPLTSGGGSGISFGLSSLGLSNLGQVFDFSAFANGAINQSTSKSSRGFNFNENPLRVNAYAPDITREVTMTIYTNPLTAGRITFSINYDECPF